MATQAFGFRPGYPQQNAADILVCSLSNADMTVTLNSVTVTVTAAGGTPWVATNTAGAYGIAGYTCKVPFSNLDAFTSYPFTVTQSGTTYTGTYHTAPANEQQSFMIFLATCDRASSVYDDAYSRVRALAESSDIPCLGIVHGDDHGYTDTRIVSGVTSSVDKYYDRSVAYLSLFGLYAADTASQAEDRLWCMRNLNLAPQWGDHEFINDLGWAYNTSTAYTGSLGSLGSPFDDRFHASDPSTGGYDGDGYVSWFKFYGHLQPPTISAGAADGNQWALTLGPVHIVAMDSVTAGDGSSGAPVSQWYGAAQVTDVLDSFTNAAKPFNILFCQHQARKVNSDGATKPLQTTAGTAAEYASLHTNTPSLATIDYTSGKKGSLIVVSGDYHAAMVTTNAGATGTNPEWYTQIVVGGLNSNGVVHTLSTGDSENGTTVEYINPSLEQAAHVVRLEYRFEENPSCVHIIHEHYDGTENWHGVFARPYGNDYVADSYEWCSPAPVSSNGMD